MRILLSIALLTACTADPDQGTDARPNDDAASGLDASEPMDAAEMDAAPGMDAAPEMDATPGIDAAPDSGYDAGPIDPSLSFFVTSSGNGASGGNYGGLSGADARCQALASNVGAGGRTWRAYLSTASNGATVHARDRIGNGPWFNARGEQIAANVGELHANGIPSDLMLTELGTPVPSDEHDILTGSMPDGTAWTEFPGNPDAPPPNCSNWTSNDPGSYTYVGHSDWDQGSGAWNSAHETTCDQAGLASTAGSGRLYCFAAD